MGSFWGLSTANMSKTAQESGTGGSARRLFFASLIGGIHSLPGLVKFAIREGITPAE